MALLMASKYLLAASVHLISDPFFNMEMMCFSNYEKFGISVLTKFLFPRKDWMSFSNLGSEKVYIAFTLSGSIFPPSAKTLCPKSLPSSKANCDFLKFTDIPNLLHFRKGCHNTARC